MAVLCERASALVWREERMDWVTFLRVMIEDERAAIEKYRLAISRADSDQLRSVLERLLHEEEFHADFLEQEIRRLKGQ